MQKVFVLRNVQNPFLIQFDVYIDTLRFTFLIIFCLADAKIGLHGLKNSNWESRFVVGHRKFSENLFNDFTAGNDGF